MDAMDECGVFYAALSCFEEEKAESEEVLKGIGVLSGRGALACGFVRGAERFLGAIRACDLVIKDIQDRGAKEAYHGVCWESCSGSSHGRKVTACI